uniref:Uncharacterized protein n=1 Tax=Euplotes harpa TaxID=151035 RepID=A0A7S3J3G2_9SPIT|mmetsp:Transcript_17838/g.20598  ORF Transcript_17838/g.20598 Transcript_17838/m.20598 type:complete len:294 (+) Transcript_17838:658-1539(+)
MGLPVVPGEKPIRTALKAYLKMMEDDEAWHKEILHLQKEHKQILFALPNGEKLQGMHEDPLEVVLREIQIENEIKDHRSKVKVVELPDEEVKGAKTVESQKKSVGAFSFLGNEETQKKLVEDFMNRNKKKVEQPQPEPQKAKVEEVHHDDLQKTVEEHKGEEVHTSKIDSSIGQSVEVINRSEAEEEHKDEVKIEEPVEEVQAEEAVHEVQEEEAVDHEPEKQAEIEENTEQSGENEEVKAEEAPVEVVQAKEESSSALETSPPKPSISEKYKNLSGSLNGSEHKQQDDEERE